MLARIHKSMKDKDQGFTLIELLVVMIIIGILAAIAIPVFLNQRQKAVDSSTKSDIKSVANEVETFFVDNNKYSTITAASLANAKLSKGSYMSFQAVTDESGYCIKGYSTGGSSNATTFFWYDSKLGGLQPGAATATAPSGACSGTLSAAVTVSNP
ncbi:MAG TPA: prepilin-type N-terminal cleavage/methylation domain-containing protein [Kineosporiaceae bacterium]|nr:prepilin-type N-terminal cleavage/methylation domain-containing protein [Kineosporiaceae bacterium]